MGTQLHKPLSQSCARLIAQHHPLPRLSGSWSSGLDRRSVQIPWARQTDVHCHRCEPCPDFIQHMGNWADVSVKRDEWKKTARYYIFFLPITCSWCSSALDVSWPPVPRDVKELIMKTLSRLQTRLVQTNWFLLDFVMCTSATSTKWTTILHCMVTQASIFSTDRYTGTTNCIEPLWKLDHWKRSADIKGYIVAFFLFKKSG